MSVIVGRNATIAVGAAGAAASACYGVNGLQSWSIDAPDSIDVTVAGNTHKKMILGLGAGMITAELIVDSDDAQSNRIADLLVDSFNGTACNAYFSSDGGTTWDYSWRVLVSANFNTGGPNDAAKRTVTFYRQFDIDPVDGDAV
jgi:hypothetical protein